MVQVHSTPSKTMTIRHAEMEDLERLLPLFNTYRMGLGVPSEVGPCRTFLFNRLMDEDALILLAFEGEAESVELHPERHMLLGFLQLFPTFSTEALNEIWIMNDLYVIPETRRRGVAKRLIAYARDFLKQRWDHGLILEVAQSQPDARALCESLGFKKDKAVDHYQLLL